MRIIAGEWGGRPIDAPPGHGTRPTADRVRETLFSMLVSRLGSFEQLRVADLFAGSGALGLEALSRGAEAATFVENDPRALATIRSNAARLGASNRTRLLPGSATALPASTPFHLIFADAPYGSDLADQAIRSVVSAGWLESGGWMSVETARAVVPDAAGFLVETDRVIGVARITLLRRP